MSDARKSNGEHSVATAHSATTTYLLQSHIAALEQLLDVYEEAVLQQSDRLENARQALAERVEALARTNRRLVGLNRRLNGEIEERERAEANLRRTERLASIGTLAAALAHEINNPLGLIMLEIHRASHGATEPRVVRSALDNISIHAKRCAQIIRTVLQLARDKPPERWPEDVNAASERARDHVHELARSSEISLVLRLEDGIPPVVANPTEIEQLLTNVLENAIHASERGAEVSIETKRVGHRVRIVVRDRGCGMNEEEQAQAMEPFYTTRGDAGGTGLGLSTCHTIAMDLGGSITVESEKGVGTAVTLELPFRSADDEPGS